jgi:hypothetical protein
MNGYFAESSGCFLRSNDHFWERKGGLDANGGWAAVARRHRWRPARKIISGSNPDCR